VPHLVLQRPIVFFDLETTGPNPAVDRIIEIALIKVHPDGRRETHTERIHPGMPIPVGSTRVHGISDADVAGAPPFAAIAARILAFIADADLAGFNVQRFDLPVLLRELATAGHGLDLTGRAVVDTQVIFHRKVPRDLTAAYRLYCGKDLHASHTARADVEACLEVLEGQLATYLDLPRTPRGLHEHFTLSQPSDALDPDGRFIWNGGEAILTFGPDGIKGRPLREVAAKDRGFLQWILRKDFGAEVKVIAQEALAGKFPARRGAT
jgi:DNA polymerase-3 subunit epsilon